MKNLEIIGIGPMERPDVTLALALSEAGAFPVIHLGRDQQTATKALEKMAAKSKKPFGVCYSDNTSLTIPLPEQVTLAILPYGLTFPNPLTSIQIICQVRSVAEATAAKAAGAMGLIAKGNEGAGLVGNDSSFILFQRIMREVSDIPVWVQGGIGVHNAAAVTAMGGRGVVLDSQLLPFPECSAPAALKNITEKLNGNETRVIDGFRVLVRPNSPALPAQPTRGDLQAFLHTPDLDQGYIPMGQEIAIATDLVKQYKKLPRLVFAFKEAMYGHLRQAKNLNPLAAHNTLAQALGTHYPIAQGPMTRVSDVPAFAAAVADAGALPFVALSLLKGEKALNLIRETRALAGDKPWGVGILGFADAELREEQLRYITEEKPPVVLIAGGRPSQAKPLEKLGIKTFLHVPSAPLLDMFLKEGAKRFIFEGRECGGHVGPLSSFVLWEKQINRLLQEEQTEQLEVFFAGGIHDAFSTAMISVMTAPLAARGVKVGVLMGTAYLYTQEAVATGAILPQFQAQALEHTETVLLETAPGHETRCLESPFAADFNAEKARMEEAGLDKKEIWAELEKLNVGRLRIAAKGIERQADDLVEIGEEEQMSRGMYMIGQAASMLDKIMTMNELHEDVATGNYAYIGQAKLPKAPRRKKKALNVAIVGMACIYPGARNIEEFWGNILAGKDWVTEVPDARWNKALYYDPTVSDGSKSHSKWGGFIPKIDFDPVEFGIPPQSLAAIDPTQLLSLLVAKQALENAGYGADTNRDNVSVIIGAEGGNDLANNYGFRSLFTQFFGEIPKELDNALPKLTEDSFPGVLANVISGRITNRLNLGGRNYTVDAACASSLAAIDLACQELILGRSEMVLAGGADLHNGINDYLMFSSTHALSRKGRCATFDSEADGIALGEGVAMVVLKREEDALRDGDTIYAVIKGVGGSSDGKSLGLTAPRKSGQVKALERAYDQAGISPAELGLVEAHGTGTVVGDKTELSALTEMMLASGALASQTHLGSVKTQIGHTKCAAGLAGLMKAALAVYHGIKPPTINLKTPNAYYNPETSPFAFQTKPALWTDDRRVAGISAFGFGGTNFHAVIENASAKKPRKSVKAWPAELLVFRGETLAETEKLLKAAHDILENESVSLRDVANSLNLYNEKAVQVCIVAENHEDARAKLNVALSLAKLSLATYSGTKETFAPSGSETKGIYFTKNIDGKVAFMFPGQGSQRVDMARDLFVAFPAMRKLLKKHPAYQQIIFPDAAFDEQSARIQKEKIKDTRLAQPLLGVVDLAIAELLKDFGIQPDMVAGHSYGELPALCFAGVFEGSQLVPLSEKRAKSILDAIEDDNGAMVAVNCPEDELTRIVSEINHIYPVNHNSPRQWVLAGTTPAIAELTTKLTELKISFRQLEVACAFHSPLLAGSKELYTNALKDVQFSEPALTVWSNTTAAPYPASPEAIKERLADHLVRPVRFSEEVAQMYEDGARIFIEVGPGKVLTGLTKSILGKDEICLNTEDKDQTGVAMRGITQLLHTLAGYVATGRNIDFNKLFEDRDARLLDLDKPEQYRKSLTTWLVDGQMALPLNGKLPEHGALPVTEPLKLAAFQQPAAGMPVAGTEAERVVHEYLNSVKYLIQAQRDVVLGYLGQSVPPSRNIEIYEPALGGLAANAPSPVPIVIETAPTQAAPAPAKPVIDVKALVMQVISDKTGYPQEMLGMDMDLEADLSIDSIKRMEIIGELRKQLGGFEAGQQSEETVIEQLAAIKTLNLLINWITEHQQQAAPATAETMPTGGVSLSKLSVTQDGIIEEWSESRIKSVLLEAVSAKTGYPQEMLGMDMDLEADLSIDSIKRMEIIGELKNNIDGLIRIYQERGEELVEKLASIKTLNGLIDWLSEALSGAQDSIQKAESLHVTPATKAVLNEKLSRLRFELTPSAIPALNPAVLKGKRFAVTDDAGEVAAAVKALFERNGAIVSIISPNDSLQGFDGLIILNIFTSRLKPTIIESFSLIKKLDFSKVKWIYTVSDTQSAIEKDTDVKLLRHFQGYAGLLKSLDKEYDETKCRLVSFTSQLPADKIAEITFNEILHTDEPCEVIYEGDKRQIMELIRSEIVTGADPDIHLDKKSVILALGGAQGITAELIVRFSKDYPCNYVLVGRSADPRSRADQSLAGLKNKEEIRKRLIASGEFKSPAEIEKKTEEIHKANQILGTISALEANGSTVTYHSLDLRDEKALIAMVEGLYNQYGRIDGVVHGAGLLEDKLFHQKTPESFERVMSTKVTPLRVLAEHLRDDVQFVTLFSSVASVYGSRGQTDYAAANSVLDKYAWELQKKIKGKVTAINWGPWKGTGMVSPSLEREYERRGIPLIPLGDGMETFVNELKYGTESQVLIMAE
ncbi:polyketide-type polyunsaturated fatty acid synthase PfaA [Dyadobacter soli]|uniref:Polyketide-type polyunsaturated fatty acid synthase PfaA n=1 Tax=Dyadobacter soli TaxID=659014 RepID=A0A1G7W1I8_9BACT|nr:type I polyketide synthase [Dyadobacter soli]SDG65781.1 polyketide-type polyunsaturated fatty acid synthase PfaA [Dyadobacter soli]